LQVNNVINIKSHKLGLTYFIPPKPIALFWYLNAQLESQETKIVTKYFCTIHLYLER